MSPSSKNKTAKQSAVKKQNQKGENRDPLDEPVSRTPEKAVPYRTTSNATSVATLEDSGTSKSPRNQPTSNRQQPQSEHQPRIQRLSSIRPLTQIRALQSEDNNSKSVRPRDVASPIAATAQSGSPSTQQQKRHPNPTYVDVVTPVPDDGKSSAPEIDQTDSTRSIRRKASEASQDSGYFSRPNGSLQEQTQLPPPLDRFLQHVAAGKAREYTRLLNEKPDIVNQPRLAQGLRREAIAGMKSGKIPNTRPYVQALAIIRFCATSTRQDASAFFNRVIQGYALETDPKFQRLMAEEEELCNSGRDIRYSPELPDSSRNVHQQKGKAAQIAGPRLSTRTGPGLGISSKKNKTNDIRFSVMDSLKKQRLGFFAPGKVFATIEYDVHPTGILSGIPGVPDTPRSRQRVVSKVIHYISIKSGEDFCLALQAKTYGGHGLSKHTPESSKIRAHAIVYSGENIPALLPNEPRLTKKAIKVTLTAGSQDLDPALRIDFGRVYTVEHSTRVHEIGEVANHQVLLRQWKEQLNA
jgi:hypothetical protein